jgi:CheY-like chemotaxis protein
MKRCLIFARHGLCFASVVKLRRGQIILVDDSKDDLLFTLEAFKDIPEKYSIVTFRSATDALKYIQENRNGIFIIVSDLNMPKMSGIELLASINSEHELKMHAIPFIFLSDSRNSVEIESAYALNAQGYFVKPNKISELTEIMMVIINYWSMTRIPRDTIYA